jgi:hypothetical protein
MRITKAMKDAVIPKSKLEVRQAAQARLDAAIKAVSASETEANMSEWLAARAAYDVALAAYKAI